MAAPEFLVLVLLFIGLLLPIGLYVLVRREHDQRQQMDRETGERVARRDNPDEE